MIKPWDVENKKQFFGSLIQSIKEGPGQSLTCLIALKQLLDETIDKIANSYTYNSYSNNNYYYQQQSDS